MAEALVSIFLEVVVAPALRRRRPSRSSPAKPNLRLVDGPARPGGRRAGRRSPDPTGSIRSAGGAVLVTAPDTLADDPTTWTVATDAAPTDAERRDLDLAWRLVRGVTSNAIVLVRDGAADRAGLGPDDRASTPPARRSTKARALRRRGRARGAACASDAFYPFPDAVEVCLAAGVTAFVQPGGSMRDAEVVAAADAAGATMLVTGIRHFRH